MANQFDVAQAIWNNRERLREVLPEVRTVRSALQPQLAGHVISCTNNGCNLSRWYTRSNLTSSSSSAGDMATRPAPWRSLRKCCAHSPVGFFLSALQVSFRDVSRPYLDAHHGDATLFAPLEALNCDISTYDFSADVAEAKRVFVFWDAHGYDLAMGILSGLFPLHVPSRPCLDDRQMRLCLQEWEQSRQYAHGEIVAVGVPENEDSLRFSNVGTEIVCRDIAIEGFQGREKRCVAVMRIQIRAARRRERNLQGREKESDRAVGATFSQRSPGSRSSCHIPCRAR